MSSDEGLEKAATLMMTLGPDEAAEVLKALGPREVQKLGAAMAAMDSQPREKVERVLDELDQHALKGSPLEADQIAQIDGHDHTGIPHGARQQHLGRHQNEEQPEDQGRPPTHGTHHHQSEGQRRCNGDQVQAGDDTGHRAHQRPERPQNEIESRPR